MYLRREEEKSKAKERVMVPMARESVRADRDRPGSSVRANEERPGPSFEGSRKAILPPWTNKDRKLGMPSSERECF